MRRSVTHDQSPDFGPTALVNKGEAIREGENSTGCRTDPIDSFDDLRVPAHQIGMVPDRFEVEDAVTKDAKTIESGVDMLTLKAGPGEVRKGRC